MPANVWTLQIAEQQRREAAHAVALTLRRVNDDNYLTGRTTVALRLSSQEEEDLRWYIEDYPSYPQEPAPRIAHQIAQNLREVGQLLFRKTFQDATGQTICRHIQGQLARTRIEIHPLNGEISRIPWELLWDPVRGRWLAVAAHSFVYAAAPPCPRRNEGLLGRDGPLRILLAIARPLGATDVSFRTVANSLIKAEGVVRSCQIDVLRPATFERLQEVLAAAAADRPYDVLHFDGHGVYEDLTARMLDREPKTKRGYLLFEGPQGGGQHVDGARLGNLLRKNNVPVLVLNACRSARVEVSSGPSPDYDTDEALASGSRSLAQEASEAGVPGVVAMRYTVYLPSAAAFVKALYEALSAGRSLGEAVAIGRRKMADRRSLVVYGRSLTLDHWLVPIAVEQLPVHLERSRVRAQCGLSSFQAGARLDPALPDPPDIGFVGGDHCLFALDRAFDRQRVVLLHGFAGAGKSTSACEFARWYGTTRGVTDAVIYTGCWPQVTLATLLDQLEMALSPTRGAGAAPHRHPSKNSRREQAIAAAYRQSILWIWDDLDNLLACEAPDELRSRQTELRRFLTDAASAGIKFLLTSTREVAGQNCTGR